MRRPLTLNGLIALFLLGLCWLLILSGAPSRTVLGGMTIFTVIAAVMAVLTQR